MPHYTTLISIGQLTQLLSLSGRGVARNSGTDANQPVRVGSVAKDAAADVVVFDCRFRLTDPDFGEQAFIESHIPGARYANLDRDLSGEIIPGQTGRHPLPEPQSFGSYLRTCGVSSSTQVVVYDDQGGGVAARLWWMLKWIGHDAVAVLDGGWHAWLAASLPVNSGTEQAPSLGDIKVSVRKHMVADVDEIESGRERLLLVDARARPRFLGIDEPIDSVAGHIPGAVSVPWAANLDADGNFLAAEQLRERYARVVGDTPAKNVVCYCGSGVTAAHDVVAMCHAGLGMPRMYPGSWSEWILDSERPI